MTLPRDKFHPYPRYLDKLQTKALIRNAQHTFVQIDPKHFAKAAAFEAVLGTVSTRSTVPDASSLSESTT